MRTSRRGIAEIASHEAIVQMPYLDSEGVWTVGIGHTASAGAPNPELLPKGVKQSMEFLLETFRRDLRKFEGRVNAAVKVPLDQHEFDALVSFDFNTGGIHKAKLTEALNAGDRARAAELFMGWSKPKAIIPRRQKEQRLFRTGIYSGNGLVPVYMATEAGKVNWSSRRMVDVLKLLDVMEGAIPPPPPDVEPLPPSEPPSGGFFSAIANLLRRIFG